jgi:hypothetical protein
MTPVRPMLNILLIALAALPLGCRQNTRAQSNLPTVTMEIGSSTFTLEIANTRATREHGLMRRDFMPPDHGMIFVFDQEQPLGFYMKNTRIPLDIIYVNAAGKVVSIKQMKPYDLTTTPSDAPAKWAIELNQGAASAAGIRVGDTLQIPAAARATAGS